MAEEPIPQKSNKAAKYVFIAIAVFVIILAAWMFTSYKGSVFSYNGITGNVVKEGALTFYQVSLPVMYQGEKRPYYFYLRNSPNDLEKIPFDGDIDLRGDKMRDMVINSTGNLSCSGLGLVGVMNLVDLYQVLGSNVVKNETLGCPVGGEYFFLQLEEGDETKITQIGPYCYNLEISNCETLKATERFMVETLVSVNEQLI